MSWRNKLSKRFSELWSNNFSRFLGITIVLLLVLGPLLTFAFFLISGPFKISEIDKSDWLTFWGGYLGFVGTVILGLVSYKQNDTLNKVNMKIMEQDLIKDVYPFIDWNSFIIEGNIIHLIFNGNNQFIKSIRFIKFDITYGCQIVHADCFLNSEFPLTMRDSKELEIDSPYSLDYPIKDPTLFKAGDAITLDVHYILNSSFGITSEIQGNVIFWKERPESNISKSCEAFLRIISIGSTAK